MHEHEEELSFVTDAVSDSAGRHEPMFMCDGQCRKERSKFFDIASIMVEDDGQPHTIHLSKDLPQFEASRKARTSG